MTPVVLVSAVYSSPKYISYRIMALVVENTFTSIPAMAQQMFPGAHYLPLFCFKNQVGVYTKGDVWDFLLIVCECC